MLLTIPEVLSPEAAQSLRESVLAAEWVEGEAAHARKYYRLTRQGVKRLAEMKDQWRVFADKIGRLMAASEGAHRDSQ